MFISKKFNYFLLTIIIFSLPFLDFLNDNFNERGIILGKSFLVLIFFILIFLVLTSIIINFFLKKIDFYDSFLISVVGFWLFFKHSIINNSLREIKENNFFIVNFSSEISLILILIIFSIFILFFLKNNLLIKKFIFIFFYLQFFLIIFSLFQLSFTKSDLVINDDKIESKILFSDLNDKKKPNIYFFILDAMQPIKEFENYYKMDLSNFREELKTKKFIYLNDTLNLYDSTSDGLSALFNLDKILTNDGKSKIKSSSYFPLVLKENKSSNLITNLKNLGYDFKWAGNYFIYCPKYNLKFCLNQNQNTVDLYLNLSFFGKSPLIQITQKFGEMLNFDFKDYIFTKSLGDGGLYKLHDGMGRLIEYLKSSNNISKPTFYFIHHMSPHHPYLTAPDCSYKSYSGKMNYDGYKSAYLCNLKKILETVEFLEKNDPESFIVFQSDHNWEMSKTSLEKRKIFNLFKVKNECKYDFNQNLNNVNMLRLILSCITGSKIKYIKN